MRLQFLLMRFAMFAAVVGVIGLVTWLLLNESNNNNSSKKSGNVNPTGSFDTSLKITGSESTDDLLIRLNQLPVTAPNASYIAKATNLQDRVLLYRELHDRRDELDSATAKIINRGLLGTLLQMHSINLFERVQDTELRNELFTLASNIAQDPDEDRSKEARITLTAISILEALDLQPEAGEQKKANDSLQSLLKQYSSDLMIVESIYNLLASQNIPKENRQKAVSFLQVINLHCVKSDNPEIRTIGENRTGQTLLIKHKILDLTGRADIFNGDDPTELENALNNLFAENQKINPPAANFILGIGHKLEQLNNNKLALKIYLQVDQRIEPDDKTDSTWTKIQHGIQRLDSVGKQVDFPELVANEHNVILFVSDSENSKQAIETISKLLVLRPNKKLSLILVSFVEDPTDLKSYLQKNQIKDLVFVSDPQRESVYHQFFPATFLPSLIVIDSDGKALDVNVNLTRLRQIIRELADSR